MNQLLLKSLRDELLSQKKYDVENYDIFLCSAGLQTMVAVPYFQSKVTLKGLCDNDPNKHSTNGLLPTISPEEIFQYSSKPLVLITNLQAYNEISNQLEQLHIPYMNAHSYLYDQEFETIETIFEQYLSDPLSKETFLSVLFGKATHDKKKIYPYYTENAYFCLPHFRMASPRSVFVDCGAYTGDTLENYVHIFGNAFQKYYAFEPGEASYTAMGKRALRLMEENAIAPSQIQLEQKGCGNQNVTGTLVEGTCGTENHLVSTGQGKHVDVVSLDNYFLNFDHPISCIKADIEGAEMDMLQGASKIIQRDKPNLSICIYHNPRDMYIIPEYIKKLVPEYQMAVRQHYYGFIETVLYCWIE